MPSTILQRLKAIVGEEHAYLPEEVDAASVKDHSLFADCPFEALVYPASPREIACIVDLCNQCQIPLTPRGGGTGVTGGALPVAGGILLSLRRLDRILHVDLSNRYAVVESGVITETFCTAIEAQGMYFPIYPGSKGSSFIGGNIAENAGSPRSCKYGTVKDFLLNLEVVLPTGEVIWTGANVYKDVTGLNLTQLFAGSEGVLGIITKAVLKIIPKPLKKRTLLAGFSDVRTACEAALSLSRGFIQPAAVELITRSAIDLTAPFVSANYPLLGPDVQAHVLLEWEEYTEAGLDLAVDESYKRLQAYDPVDVFSGISAGESDLLWSLRNRIGEAMTAQGCRYRDIDSCVPPANVFAYLESIDGIASRYGRRLICFGHAMDGNLHTMLLLPEGDSGVEALDLTSLLTDIYNAALSLGGTISGEHGIGCLQNEFLPLQLSATHLALMRRVKMAFDPRLILNPGKLLLT